MKIFRFLIAMMALIILAMTWQADRLPAWIAVSAVVALAIWGLNLDWRRKKKVADARAAHKEREERRAG